MKSRKYQDMKQFPQQALTVGSLLPATLPPIQKAVGQATPFFLLIC